MMKNLMRSIVLLFATFLTTNISVAQGNKLGLSIEYSPNFSSASNSVLQHQYKLSHNAVLKLVFNPTHNITPTIGLGFLNTGSSRDSRSLSSSENNKLEIIENFNYLIIPIGLKIKFFKIFLIPEAGLGINLFNSTTSITKFSNGETTSVKSKLDKENLNSITFPLSLSVGSDFNLANYSLSFGLKGFYGINRLPNSLIQTRTNNYYGVGLFLGMNL